jgi:hypothetical protein
MIPLRKWCDKFPATDATEPPHSQSSFTTLIIIVPNLFLFKGGMHFAQPENYQATEFN